MRRLAGVLLVLGLALACALPFRSFMVDDSFITCRYAHNLGAGQGFCFNPPERVEGYSNALLVVLLAGLDRLGLPAPVGAQAVGLLAHLLTILLIIAAGRSLDDPLDGLVPGLILACAAAPAYWAVAGLETPLHTLLLTALALAAATPTGRGGRVVVVRAALAVLVVVSRTEGVLPALVLMGWVALRDTSPGRGRLREILGLLAPVLVGGLVYHGWRWAYFGTPFSGPALAKSAGIMSSWDAGLRYLALAMVEYAPALLAAGLVATLAEAGPLTAPLALLAAVQVVVILGMGGDWMPLYRFLLPLAPLAALEGWRGVRGWARNGFPETVAVGLGLLLTVWQLSYVPTRVTADMYVAADAGRLQALVAARLKASYPPGTLLAVGDVGRLGYLTGFPILDMKGLVTPAMVAAFRPVQDGGTTRMGIDPAAVFARSPDLILLALERGDGSGRTRGVWAPDDDLVGEPLLHLRYREVSRFRLPDSTLPLEYLLMERR